MRSFCKFLSNLGTFESCIFDTWLCEAGRLFSVGNLLIGGW